MFRTTLTVPRAPFDIQHTDPILCIGSCFAEHIGERLSKAKFSTALNPTGIVYNPVSVRRCLDLLLGETEFTREDLFQHDELWHSFDHHGSFSDPDPDIVLMRIREALAVSRRQLAAATRLILTLGTAHVFTWLPANRPVSNCHKLPGQVFSRRRISVAECVVELSPVLAELKSNYPGLEVIATVSPVRYLRDGLIEHQRSKATLLLAIAELSDLVHYFPAYELVIDDLRDYRFYEADMAHPNGQAIQYIWDHFRHTFFNDTTKSLVRQTEQISTAVAHRPLHPGTVAHRRFAATQLEKIAQLQAAYPYLDFSREIVVLESYL